MYCLPVYSNSNYIYQLIANSLVSILLLTNFFEAINTVVEVKTNFYVIIQHFLIEMLKEHLNSNCNIMYIDIGIQ